MKKIVSLLLSCLCVGLIGVANVGCGKKKPAPVKGAKPQVDPVKQRAKAVSAYQKLVEKYPESPFAPQAKERLKVLKPADPKK